MLAVIMGPGWFGRMQNHFTKIAMPVSHLGIFDTDLILIPHRERILDAAVGVHDFQLSDKLAN